MIRRLLMKLLAPDNALELIADARQAMLAAGGSDASDDLQTGGELAMVGACYAAPRYIYTAETLGTEQKFTEAWPETWHWTTDKRMCCRFSFATPETDIGRRLRLRELAEAGAFIVAEIERLQRKGATCA